MKCDTCGGKDAVVGEKVERNEKGEVFCSPCRTGRKTPWWNWGGELKRLVPRAQVKGTGITDPEKRQREVQRILKGLREVWMQIGVEKIDTHEGISVKALLDNRATGLFISKKCTEREDFKLIKLRRPIMVRNVDGTGNSGGLITHEVEVNLYFKGHVERVRIDVCDLGKTEVILGMPWLQAHNPEIDWEKGEVKMMRCLPICRRYMGKKEMGPEIKKRRKGEKEVQEDEIERIRWAADEKEDWGREEEMELDHRKVETMVPQKFHKWLKVFGKVESERMPTRKIWDHTIDLKEEFKASKARVYPLFKNEREEVQQFIQDHL